MKSEKDIKDGKLYPSFLLYSDSAYPRLQEEAIAFRYRGIFIKDIKWHG